MRNNLFCLLSYDKKILIIFILSLFVVVVSVSRLREMQFQCFYSHVLIIAIVNRVNRTLIDVSVQHDSPICRLMKWVVMPPIFRCEICSNSADLSVRHCIFRLTNACLFTIIVTNNFMTASKALGVYTPLQTKSSYFRISTIILRKPRYHLCAVLRQSRS